MPGRSRSARASTRRKRLWAQLRPLGRCPDRLRPSHGSRPRLRQSPRLNPPQGRLSSAPPCPRRPRWTRCSAEARWPALRNVAPGQVTWAQRPNRWQERPKADLGSALAARGLARRQTLQGTACMPACHRQNTVPARLSSARPVCEPLWARSGVTLTVVFDGRRRGFKSAFTVTQAIAV